MLLDVVVCCCAKFETGQTFQPTTPNISFVPWSPKRSATMLDPFAHLFQHCWGRARSLRMVYKDLWFVSFQRYTAGPNIVGSCCIRLHTTANRQATTPNIVAPTMLGVVASVCTQPYWLISRSTITFHRYFLCSRFCEFHSKCEFGEQEVWVVLTFFELGSSYHLTDTKINDVKVLFLDYHIKTSYYCNNLQPECLPESSASSPSAADKSINDSKVRKENPFTNSVVHLLCTREVGLQANRNNYLSYQEGCNSRAA